MVGILQRFGIIFFSLIYGLVAVDVAAQPEKAAIAQREKVSVAQSAMAEPIIQRVIVLLPARSLPETSQVQWRIDRERASHSKTRRKSRMRSTFAKAAVPASSAIMPPDKLENRMSPLVSGIVPGSGSGSAGVAAIPGSAASHVGKIDVVPPEQRVTLAQALLADSLMERLSDRLGLVVVSENETNQALQALHWTPKQAMQPDNARRLCARLNCQAILMPRVTACTIHEGATRDAAVFADIRIVTSAALENKQTKSTNPEKTGAVENNAVKRIQVPARNTWQSAPSTDSVPIMTHWPAQIEAAGTALADRVLFHKQYQKPQGDLIRDAAQQTVNLLLHALRMGEQAPFMRANDRIAVTPVLMPGGADKLIFTATGRRVAPSPLTDIHAEISALFLPDLQPIAPDRIITEDNVRSALVGRGMKEASLWAGEDQPALARVQTLGHSLHVEYVLLTRITDVELSESEPNRERTANANTSANEHERSARVEATAALVRVEDGALLWHDRAIATMMASPPTGASKPQTNQTLTRDATHFALVELQRRLRQYRSTFER